VILEHVTHREVAMGKIATIRLEKGLKKEGDFPEKETFIR